MPAGDDADLTTVDGLTTWAEQNCNLVGLGACNTVKDRVEAMCLETADDPCRPVVLIRSVGRDPAEEGESAFFGDWASATPVGEPDFVIFAYRPR